MVQAVTARYDGEIGRARRNTMVRFFPAGRRQNPKIVVAPGRTLVETLQTCMPGSFALCPSPARGARSGGGWNGDRLTNPDARLTFHEGDVMRIGKKRWFKIVTKEGATPDGNDFGNCRLILRPFAETDFRAVHEYASDPQVVRYVSFGPNSEEQTREFIHRAMTPAETPRTKYDFAVTLKDSGPACRRLRPLSQGRKTPGLHRLRPQRPGSGDRDTPLNSPARWWTSVFEDLDLHRITAFCDPDNTASAHVIEKTGMRREGLMRQERLGEREKWLDHTLLCDTRRTSGKPPMPE